MRELRTVYRQRQKHQDSLAFCGKRRLRGLCSTLGGCRCCGFAAGPASLANYRTMQRMGHKQPHGHIRRLQQRQPHGCMAMKFKVVFHRLRHSRTHLCGGLCAVAFVLYLPLRVSLRDSQPSWTSTSPRCDRVMNTLPPFSWASCHVPLVETFARIQHDTSGHLAASNASRLRR